MPLTSNLVSLGRAGLGGSRGVADEGVEPSGGGVHIDEQGRTREERERYGEDRAQPAEDPGPQHQRQERQRVTDRSTLSPTTFGCTIGDWSTKLTTE